MTATTTGSTDIQIMDRDNGGYAILQQDTGHYMLVTRHEAVELAAALRLLTDADRQVGRASSLAGHGLPGEVLEIGQSARTVYK
jgi:hypothetical protein